MSIRLFVNRSFFSSSKRRRKVPKGSKIRKNVGSIGYVPKRVFPVPVYMMPRARSISMATLKSRNLLEKIPILKRDSLKQTH